MSFLSSPRWLAAVALSVLAFLLEALPEYGTLSVLGLLVGPAAVAAASVAFLPAHRLSERPLLSGALVLLVAALLAMVPLVLAGLVLWPFGVIPLLGPALSFVGLVLALVYLGRLLSVAPLVFLEGRGPLDALFVAWDRSRGTGALAAVGLLLVVGIMALLERGLAGAPVVLRMVPLGVLPPVAVGALAAWSYRPAGEDELGGSGASEGTEGPQGSATSALPALPASSGARSDPGVLGVTPCLPEVEMDDPRPGAAPSTPGPGSSGP